MLTRPGGGGTALPTLSATGLRAVLLILAVAAGGCGDASRSDRTGPAQDAASLIGDCPRGDRPWREAIADAASRERLADLEGKLSALSDRHPDRWEPVWARAECLFRGPDPRSAAEIYAEALRRATREDDPTGIACAANRIGFLRFRDGALDEAHRFYEKASAAARRAKRDDLEAFILNNLAGLLTTSGRLAEASGVLDQVVDRLDRLGMKREARDARANQARLLIEMGDAARAAELLEPLYRGAEVAGDADRAGEAALLLGMTSRAMLRWAEARQWYERIPDDATEWAVLRDQHLGRLASLEGRNDEARSFLERALKGARERGLRAAELFSLAFLAEVDLRAGRFDAAEARLRQVIGEADRAGEHDPSWVARGVLGRTLLAAGRPRDAADVLREVVGILERQATALDTEQMGFRFLRERVDPCADLAVALVRSAPRESAAEVQPVLDLVESAHARTFRRALGGGATSSPAPCPTRRLVQALPAGTILLDFLVGEEHGVVVAVGRGRVAARELPGWRRLRGPLRGYGSALVRPLSSAEARLAPLDDFRRGLAEGRSLTRSLLDPVRDFFDEAKRIVMIPDQELALLPLAALPLDDGLDGGWPEFLGARHEVISLLTAAVPSDAGPTRVPVLLAGDPLPDDAGEEPGLRYAGEEIGRLASLWGSSRVSRIEGPRLCRAVLDATPLEGFGTIHLATHALASSSDPRRCGVVLSRGEVLGFDAIRARKLGPAVVVLSACRTGQGEMVPGEGIIGLGSAFLEAGAAAVIVSLWGVDDRSGADLMVRLHERLRAGDDPARALTVASRALAREHPHPAYWAPFVITARPAAIAAAGP